MVAVAAAVLVFALSGRGASSGAVHVQVTAPVDGSTTSAERVTVRGIVTPEDATVQVAGQAAQVGSGLFTTSVPLQPGVNQLDVVATAQGGTPVSTTIEVTRAHSSSTPASAPARQQPKSTPNSTAASNGTAASNSTPAPSGSSAASSSAEGGSPEGTDCGGGLHAGQGTSCAFAENVRNAYNEAPGAYLQVYSPTTEQSYAMECTPVGAGVSCHGGNYAVVSW